MYYKVPKKKRKLIENQLASEHRNVAKECLIAINTSFSLSLYMKLENSCFDDIQKPNPNDYLDAYSYLLDAQAYAIIAKNLVFCREDELLPALVSGFFEQEKLNRSTNERFAYSTFDPLLDQVRHNVRQLIGAGPRPYTVYGEKTLRESVRFGPGSSYLAQGSAINPMDKIRNGKVSLTSGCVPLWDYFTEHTSLSLKEPLLIRSDFFGSVPKNFKSLRTISIGNDGNGLVQLALGKHIRRRLERFYDLSKQHELHKQVVKDSSISLSHATVDIKSASNSVCKEVVKALLPPIWYSLLNQSRHHTTQIGEYVHDLELFSSMGNGFTFELETIIFLAICMTLPHRSIISERNPLGDISVFGDDIICRDEDYDLLVSRLSHFGFQVNMEKSFHGLSPFRESCGADVYNGVDVTPTYLRGNVDACNLESYYVLPNKIMEISMKLYGKRAEHTRFARAYALAKRLIPSEHLILGIMPDRDELRRLGDLELSVHGWLHSYEPRTRNKQVIHQTSYSPVMYKKLIYTETGEAMYDDDDVLAYALYRGPSSGSVVRRRVKGSRTKQIVIYG